MIAKFARGMKKSVKDPRWFLFYLQRDTTLDPRHRDRIAALIAHALPKSPERSTSPTVQKIADGLKSDGFAPVEGIVTPAQLDDIMNFLSTRKCYDPRHPEMPGFSHPSEAHSTCYHAYYPDDDVVATPHLMEIANHPTLISALEIVFGCKPTITSALMWWLFSTYDFSDGEREQFLWNTNNMHRDIDDWLHIKLFIYLTDVDEKHAPHLFLKGSHRGGIGEKKRLISLEDVRKDCSQQLETVVGGAGTAWLENPFGFHVATRPDQGNRLLAAISYSLFPLPYTIGQHAFDEDADATKFDAYINRRWLSKSKPATLAS
jgi:hypothetical protein